MSLIARGRGLRRMATEGFGRSAQLEARENQILQQIDAAQDAQQMQTLGVGGGIGAMYGIRGMGAAKTALGAIPEVGQTLAGTSISAPVSGTLVPAAEIGSVGIASGGAGGVSVSQGAINAGIKVGASGAGAGAAGGAAGAAGAGAGAAGGTVGVAGAGAAGGTAGGTVVAGNVGVAGAGATGGAAGGAAASGGMLSGLATLAAPIAIGLGVAYLINKLFD